jgi:hypothetical protein
MHVVSSRYSCQFVNTKTHEDSPSYPDDFQRPSPLTLLVIHAVAPRRTMPVTWTPAPTG